MNIQFVAVVWILVGLALPIAAQTTAPAPEAPATKLETLLLTRGTLISKDFHPQGEVGGTIGGGAVDIDGLIVKPAIGTGPALKGLRVEVKEGGRLERSNTSFLDLEELADFVKALEFFSSPESQGQPLGIATSSGARPHRETTFSTKGSFSLTCFGQGTARSCSVESGRVVKTRVFLDGTGLAILKQKVEAARGLLAQQN